MPLFSLLRLSALFAAAGGLSLVAGAMLSASDARASSSNRRAADAVPVPPAPPSSRRPYRHQHRGV